MILRKGCDVTWRNQCWRRGGGCLQYLLAQVMEQNLLEPRNCSAGAYFPQYSHFRRFAFLSSSEKQGITWQLPSMPAATQAIITPRAGLNYSQGLSPRPAPPNWESLKHEVQTPTPWRHISQEHPHFPHLQPDCFHADWFYPNSYPHISDKTALLNRRVELITNAYQDIP